MLNILLVLYKRKILKAHIPGIRFRQKVGLSSKNCKKKDEALGRTEEQGKGRQLTGRS